jgi:DNA repair protein RAD16
VFYNDRKKITAEQLAQYDVVLTTYPVVEYEYRVILNTYKVACEYCGRKLLPKSLAVHLNYFCGPDAVRTER